MEATVRCFEVGQGGGAAEVGAGKEGGEGCGGGGGGGSGVLTAAAAAAAAGGTAPDGKGEGPVRGGVKVQVPDGVKREAKERREKEERALTADLKDRVATVEGQWTEALGSAIVGTRERVKSWLVEDGGWDKELLEDVE